MVTAESFISEYTKLRYLSIHNTFIRNKINISNFIMTQALALKNDLEELNLSTNTNSIAFLDIVDFYPSILRKIIEKVV